MTKANRPNGRRKPPTAAQEPATQETTPTWSRAITCRDLAADLRAARYRALRNDEKQTSVPLLIDTIEMLVEMLEAEHKKNAAAVAERFGRPRPVSRLRRRPSAVEPGDLVLCGSYGISMPGDWFPARVLWTDGTEMLTEHQPPSGGRQRNVWGMENALAVGTSAQLVEFRERARKHVDWLWRKVDQTTGQLGEARRAVYDALEKMGAAKGGIGR